MGKFGQLYMELTEDDGGGDAGAPSTNTGNIDGYQNAGITPAMKFRRKLKKNEVPGQEATK